MSIVTSQCLLMRTESWSIVMSTNRGHVMIPATATDNGVHEITKNYRHGFIEKCYSLSYIVLIKIAT